MLNFTSVVNNLNLKRCEKRFLNTMKILKCKRLLAKERK